MRKEEDCYCICMCLCGGGGDLCVSVEDLGRGVQLAVCNSATEFVFLYVKEEVELCICVQTADVAYQYLSL